MFRIVLSRKADRALEQFDNRTTQRVIAALDDIAENPFFGRAVKKLRGELAGKYRLRIGRVRVVYTVIEEQDIVRVDDIAYRGTVY